MCKPLVTTLTTTHDSFRIRRVKCDEQKPECQRCVQTGRKCDGYDTCQNALAHCHTSKISSYAIPFSVPGSQHNRRLLHFYCVQGAIDLAGYTNSDLWSKTILQHAHRQPIVRQAVVALSSWQVDATNTVVGAGGSQRSVAREDHLQQYGKALRGLRKYTTQPLSSQINVESVLICCALFFCYENGRGDHEAALTHLENGLHILKSKELNEQKLVSTPIYDHDALSKQVVHLFYRLDCQATLFDDSRTPLLNLSDSLHWQNDLTDSRSCRFHNVSEAQESLDILQNRLARLLTNGLSYKNTPANELPQWILTERSDLQELCERWYTAMDYFVSNQPESLRYVLENKPGALERVQDGQIGLHVRVLTLHYRLWRMFLRSSFPPNLTIWTMSPNPEAEEILAQCEYLASSTSTSSGVAPQFSSLKLSSETGILAPLFILAMKCSDVSLRQRAIKQIQMLEGRREGLYDAKIIDRLLFALDVRADKPKADDTDSAYRRRSMEEWMEWVHQPDFSELDNELEHEETNFPVQSLENTTGAALWADKGGLVEWAKSLGVG